MLKGIFSLLLLALFSIPSNASPHTNDDRYYDTRAAPVLKAGSSKHDRVRYRARRTVEAVVHGGRPAGCPARAWCGCFLMKHLGLNRRDLWLARNWAHVGSPSGLRPGAIAVWRHHVGKVVDVAPGRIKLLSGNDGRAVRERWRSARGVIAYRVL